MSISTFYRVSINGVTESAPRNGFIDTTTIERYRVVGAPGLTLDLARAKERANIRWEWVVANMGLMANCYADNIVATSATATVQASVFAFTVEVERGDDVLSTPDETVPGTRLSGAAALRRCVARALLVSQTEQAEIFDPTLTVAPGNAVAAIRVGPRIEPLVIGPLALNLAAAEVLVTVTKIANVG